MLVQMVSKIGRSEILLRGAERSSAFSGFGGHERTVLLVS